MWEGRVFEGWEFERVCDFGSLVGSGGEWGFGYSGGRL